MAIGGRDLPKAASLRFAMDDRAARAVPRWPRRSIVGGRIWAFAVALLAMPALSAPARADLKLCNTTPSRIGVAIGYQDTKGFTTEGWWTIASQSCETLLKGKLARRFYYIHAVDYDRGGEWSGDNFMCIDEKSFIIRDEGECKARGFKRSGFYEVDTGDQRHWTVRLADPARAKGSAK